MSKRTWMHWFMLKFSYRCISHISIHDMLSKYISKVSNFCLPVKIGSAILNDQVGSHMLNHLMFMFWWRSTRFCVPHCKEETWLNRLIWNLSRLIFSIKSSCLAEIGQLWHYFHESQQHFEDSRGCLSEE
jgi:hypothetical protein